jgi:hypothetical protein
MKKKFYREKYNSQNVKNMRQMHQCKGERDYFGYLKDCDKCKLKYTCICTPNLSPFVVDTYNRKIVFADNLDDACEYVEKGLGELYETKIELTFHTRFRKKANGFFCKPKIIKYDED